jgi:predicted ATPase/DNA-binding CsgD family transcriptional regulator
MGTAVELTRRGKEVAELVGLGLTNREIAQRLFLSERTVEWHVEQIMNRLGFTSRSQIAAWVAASQAGAPIRVPGVKRRGNLPASLTAFVGREREVAACEDLVARNRLVTVIGPGGIGKTRLALEVAARLEPRYPDGSWICDLAPLADPALLGDALVETFSIATSSADRLVAVREHLRDRACVLVLDNCEHLLAASSAVARDLLAGAADLRIVATSRAPLGVIGEAVSRLDALTPDEAIDLFALRAGAAAPGFRVDASNFQAVGMICSRLDRVPLALELVSPRLRLVSVQELAQRVLEPDARGAGTDRHGSLDAVADWSYRLLDGEERALFRHLGVFAGWFELDDAAAVAPHITTLSATMADLVEKSMVVLGRSPSGAPRHRLLEMLKEFARRRLADEGELDAARLRHAERMVTLNEHVGLRYSDELKPKLASMVDDTREALRTLIKRQPKRAAWLAGTLRKFWTMTGRAPEGARWCKAALAAGPEESMERSWLELAYAILLVRSGASPGDGEWLRDPVAAGSRFDNTPMAGHMFLAAGLLYSDLERRRVSEDLFRRSVAAFVRDGDELMVNAARNNLAGELVGLGRLDEAIEMQKQTVESQRRLGGSELSYYIDTLAQAYALSGLVEEARRLELESVQHMATDQPLPSVYNLHALAWAAAMRGKTETALRLHYYATRLFDEAGMTNKEPLGPAIYEVIERLEADVGPEVASRLRADGEALSLAEAFDLARREG